MNAEPLQILVADDEPNLRKVLRALLGRDGYEVHLAADGQAACELLDTHHIDIVITDLRMPRLDGMELLRKVSEEHNGVPLIMITAHGSIDTAVEAMKMGAFDYITKPFDKKALREIVAKAARTRLLTEQEASLDRDATGRFKIVGRSAPILEVFQLIERVANTPATVLVTGESGTGKELIARALHENSIRSEAPYIRVNCAAIPPTLIESELFGYDKGAFTGAETAKPGRFELAHEGTLFLDEIGEISQEMQVKLLRAIQEGEFERVGGITTIKVDVRLITATNQNLKTRIEEGLFREDLYYRLNVVPIHMPPLRERKTDIPLLVDHFLSKHMRRLGKEVHEFESEAIALLLGYPWPGNIRELENVIERCVLFSDGDTVVAENLPPELTGYTPHRNNESPVDPTIASEAGLKDQVKAATATLERQLILRALEQTGRNVTKTARLLKISRKSLQVKMKELGLRDDPPNESK